MHNKRGLVVTDKLLITILVILVLASALIFIFRVDLTKFFGFLPSFSSQRAGEILPGEQAKVIPNDEAIAKCNQIAKINLNYIYILKADGELEKTNLYWDDGNKKIMLDIPFGLNTRLGKDVVIGGIIVTNLKTIAVSNEFLDAESQSYKKYADKLPPVSFIKKLNNSYLLGNIDNRLCEEISK